MAKHDLEWQYQQLLAEIEQYEKDLATTQNIVKTYERKHELLKRLNDLNKKIQHQRMPQAGALDRVFGAIAPFSAVPHAIYEANAKANVNTYPSAGFKLPAIYAQKFSEAYTKAVYERLLTSITGKNYTAYHHPGRDLMSQMGVSSNAAKIVGGLGLDIVSDPSMYGATKATFQILRNVGQIGKNYIFKIPGITRGLDNLGRLFNLFHDLEKTHSKEFVDQFKLAFTQAVESKNFTKLHAMGIDLSAFTKNTPRVKLTPEELRIKNLLEKSPQGQSQAMRNALKLAPQKWLDILTLKAQPFNGEIPSKAVYDILETAFPVQFAKNLPNAARRSRLFGLFQELEKTQTPEFVKKFKETLSHSIATHRFAPIRQLAIEGVDTALSPEYSRVVGHILGPFLYPSTSIARTKPVQKPMNAFLELLESSIGKPTDTANSIYKWLLSWSPLFNTRNAMGTTLIGLSQKIGAKEYWEALKMTFQKGDFNKTFYNELNKAGIFKQMGMFSNDFSRFLYKINLPARLANLSESVNRAALALASKNKGKSLTEAVEETQRVFFKYNKGYMTDFEKKIMMRLMPFYSFAKGQMQFWPSELINNTPFWRVLHLGKNATLPDNLHQNPQKRQSWEQDMLTFFNIGGFGFQIEDFAKNVTGNVKNLFNQLTPVLTKPLEALLDWNVFKDRSISKDTRAGMWQYLPGKELLGYNPVTNTVDPWRKFAIESLFSPVLQPLFNSVDSKKPWYSVLTSVRPYNLSNEAMDLQTLMMHKTQQLEGTFWQHQQQRLLGTTPSSSAPVNVNIVGINPNAYKTSPNVPFFGIDANKSVPETGKLVTQKDIERGFQQYWYEKFRGGPVSTDPMLNAYNDYLNKRQYYNSLRLTPGIGDMGANELLNQLNQTYEATRPRNLSKEAGIWDPKQFQNVFTLGISPMEQAFNRAQREYINLTSKIAEIYRQNQRVSPQTIQESVKYEMEAFKTRMTMAGMNLATPESQKLLSDASQALNYEASYKLQKFWREIDQAKAKILDLIAESQPEGIHRLAAEKQAAIAKVQSSDEMQKLLDARLYDKAQQLRQATAAKYDRKIQEAVAKQSQELSAILVKQSEQNLHFIIESLEQLLQRGNITIQQALQTKQGALLAINQSNVANILRAVTDSVAGITGPTTEHPSITKTTKPDVNTIYCLPSNPEILVRWDGQQYHIFYPEALKEDPTHLVDFLRQATAQLPGTHAPGSNAPPWHAQPYQPETLAPSDEQNKLILDLQALTEQLESSNLNADALLDVIERTMQLVQKAIQQGIFTNDPTALTNNLLDASKAIKQNAQDTTKMIQEANDQFNKAWRELQAYRNTFDIGQQEKSAQMPTGLGLNEKFLPMWMAPDSQAIINNAERARQAMLAQSNQKLIDDYQKMAFNFMPMVGAFASRDNASFMDVMQQGADESQTDYTKRIQETLQAEMAMTDISTEEGQKRKQILMALSNDMLNIQQAMDRNMVESARQAAQARMQIAVGMIDNIQQAAATIYEASGRQSKEAFYVMKAAEIAQIIIKGISATMSAYSAGLSVGGPYAPAIGAAYAATAAAFYAAQLGAALAVTLNGPSSSSSSASETTKITTQFLNSAGELRATKVAYTTKAEGGLISGGSGTKDDVPILAMGGEYIMRKEAVKKYGHGFMEALNQGLLDIPSAISWTVTQRKPNVAVRTRYAEGGLVADLPAMNPQKTEITMINVTDPRELDSYLATAQGQNAILNVLSSRKETIRRILLR